MSGYEVTVAPLRAGGRTPGVGRVWALSAGLMLLAVAVYLTSAQGLRAIDTQFHLPWWSLAGMFFVTESNPIRVRYRRQGQLVSLNDVPLVLGLYFAAAPELLLGLLLGTAGALIRARRQSPQQLAFNISHYFLAGVVATLAFNRVVQGDPAGPPGWSGALLASVIVTLMGHAAITVAIVLAGSQPQVDRLRQVLSLGMTGSITVTMVTLTGIEMLTHDVRAVLLLVVPLLVGLLTYRGWLHERGQADGPDAVYESTRMLHRSPEVESAVLALLAQARGMFRAERAEITLYPAEGDEAVRTGMGPGTEVQAMVPVRLDPSEVEWASQVTGVEALLYPGSESTRVLAPFRERGIREAMVVVIRRNDRVVATVLVGNRVGESEHFDNSDLELFEPLARKLGAVLESGTLEHSLQQLRDLETQLRHQAYHDPLTSLPNRSQFIERVEMALEFSSGDRARMAVLFIGIDDFRMVNEALGHPIGDRLLIALADRIKAVLGPEDGAARLGGDEFGVFLDCAGVAAAEDVANALLAAIRRPIVLDGHELHIRASLGIAMGDTCRWADELLRNADVAMESAKGSGKDRVQVFSADMHVAVLERHELLADLQRAIEREEFVLHYQPVVDLSSGSIVALEALVRWEHPTRGLMMPDSFIPLAEESGLILPIGRLILRLACEQARVWHETLPGHGELAMAVNLSARQLQHTSFVGETMQLIAESGVRASSLILEITETVLMDDTDRHVAKLRQLKSLGLRLAMDDFGTGYSSLSFLSQLPIDILKIAKPFVDGLGHSERDQAFASAIVRLGQTVGMALIAEGVERTEQLDELRKLGCDMVQGWLFARAASAETTERLLLEGLDRTDGKIIRFPA